MNNKFFTGLLSLLLLIPFFAHAEFDEDELLLPEEAFALTVSAIDEDTIRAEWKIAENYYLYKSKFKIATSTPGVILGEPQFPKGKLKQDEFLGR